MAGAATTAQKLSEAEAELQALRDELAFERQRVGELEATIPAEAAALAEASGVLRGPAAVIDALCRSSLRIGPVPKDAQMESGQKYQYRSIRAIMAKAQTVFAEEGIVILPVRIKRETRDYQTRNNDTAMMTHHKFTWRIYCRTGDSIKIVTFGEARDSGDKGGNKAQTAAYKYAVIAALSLAEGHDDPDDEAPDARAGRVEQAGPAARQQKADADAAAKAAMGRWNEVAKQLTDAEKARLRDWCDRDNVATPASKVPRTVELYETWMSYATELIASRARDVPSEAEAPQTGPSTDAEIPQDLPSAEEALAAAAAAEAAVGDAVEAQAEDERPPVRVAAGDPPPKDKWTVLQCWKCKADINGYEQMPCPMPNCGGYLTVEEPFHHRWSGRGDDAPVLVRHRWATRRGDGRWPGQF